MEKKEKRNHLLLRNGEVVWGATTKHRREQEDNALAVTPDRAARQQQDRKNCDTRIQFLNFTWQRASLRGRGRRKKTVARREYNCFKSVTILETASNKLIFISLADSASAPSEFRVT